MTTRVSSRGDPQPTSVRAPKVTLATAQRVLTQLRHDPRTVALMVAVPAVLMVLLRYVHERYTSSTMYAGPEPKAEPPPLIVTIDTTIVLIGLPAMIVPGTFGGGHQGRNAERLARAGAAIRIADDDLAADSLLAAVDGLDRDRLQSMAAASRALGRPAAARDILAVLREAVAIPIALVAPVISMAIYGGVVVMLLVPDRRIERAIGE